MGIALDPTFVANVQPLAANPTDQVPACPVQSKPVQSSLRLALRALPASPAVHSTLSTASQGEGVLATPAHCR